MQLQHSFLMLFKNCILSFFFSHDKVSPLTFPDGNIGTDSGPRSGLGALFELSIRIPDRRKLSLSVRIRLQ